MMIIDKSLVLIEEKLGWLTKPQPGHLVQFYRSNSNLLIQLSEFIISGLRTGDSCVVIATPSHVQALNERLEKCGLNVSVARTTGQYVMLDAAETLTKFMVNDMPDRNRFFEVVGTLLEKFTQKDKPIRAYGEMVALLWKVGNKKAVIALESLWNELADTHSFSLFCAYPELHFVMDKNMPEEIRKHHNVNLLNKAIS